MAVLLQGAGSNVHALNSGNTGFGVSNLATCWLEVTSEILPAGETIAFVTRGKKIACLCKLSTTTISAH
jgi:hypothetical protein